MNFKNNKAANILYVVFCLVAPWSIAAMQITLILIVIASAIDAILKNETPLIWHPFFIFPILYVISVFISVLTSADIVISAESAFNTDWYLLLLPFIISLKIDEKTIYFAFKILVISATIVGIYGIAQFFLGFDYIRLQQLTSYGEFYRAEGAYGFYLTFAGNQMIFFAIAFAMFLKSTFRDKFKYWLILFIIILFLSVIVTFGRSTWLGMFFVIFLGSILTSRKSFITAMAGLVIVFIFISMFFPLMLDRFISIFNLSQNIGRVTLWKTSWNIIMHHPFFGIGPGFFSDYFQIYKVAGYFDRMGHAHNDYLNTAVYGGLIGLLTWLGMWIAWFYYAIKTYVRLSNNNIQKIILLAAILALSGILIASVFQCYYTDLENNLVWWFVISTGAIIFAKNNPGKVSK